MLIYPPAIVLIILAFIGRSFDHDKAVYISVMAFTWAAAIFDCMKAINAAEITAPVHIGDIVIENVCGTGVNVVASAEDELG